MPILIPNDLPAYNTLTNENIFVMNSDRAAKQDIRPIEIAIVNLMPTKIETETQLLRLLGNTPLQVNLTLIKMETYESQNTSKNHLEKFYKTFDEIKDKKFDGMLVTGAPLENIEYDDIVYIDELKKILDFSGSNVTSSMYICWGAFFALNHFYQINKNVIDEKIFGVYQNKKNDNFDQLLKGMDDVFNIPMSRYTVLDDEQINENKNLKVLAGSDQCGYSIIKDISNNRFFVTGHLEYDKHTLKDEYLRDIKKGLNTKKPVNYFVNDNTDDVLMNWSGSANLLFYNWLNHYVYQITPYRIEN